MRGYIEESLRLCGKDFVKSIDRVSVQVKAVALGSVERCIIAIVDSGVDPSFAKRIIVMDSRLATR